MGASVVLMVRYFLSKIKAFIEFLLFNVNFFLDVRQISLFVNNSLFVGIKNSKIKG